MYFSNLFTAEWFVLLYRKQIEHFVRYDLRSAAFNCYTDDDDGQPEWTDGWMDRGWIALR